MGRWWWRPPSSSRQIQKISLWPRAPKSVPPIRLALPCCLETKLKPPPEPADELENPSSPSSPPSFLPHLQPPFHSRTSLGHFPSPTLWYYPNRGSTPPKPATAPRPPLARPNPPESARNSAKGSPRPPGKAPEGFSSPLKITPQGSSRGGGYSLGHGSL